ncbi:putative RNA-directed DNA polymerase from transposon X-element [Trichonephila clavipes]|nr:putative RNA-directed DNA polymerase from transposon X-element [Trichonephila clavipes]
MTKRTILSAVQGKFDPLGIFTAATLLPKMLLQETWKVKLAWDSPLPLGLCNKFDKWFKEILLLQNLEILRYCEMNSDSDLNVFVDASKEAYAACIFVRTKLASGIKLHLLRAKARVASTKSVSMPRLELLACCVGARLANSIRNSLDIPDLKITYWSDSMVALHWIKNNGEWLIFVSIRIKEIAKISTPENWRHVPGRKNPADVLSRGCSERHLLESKWFGGPEWLLGDAVSWPTNELQCETKVLDYTTRNQLKVNLYILPADRVRDAGVFEVIGIDLAGPLFLKNGEKLWVVLYICAVYRAVHLELVTALSTNNFLLSLRRFIARRGRPSVVYTDNGTNFRGAIREFKNLDWIKIERETVIQRIKWKFNPPTAAWWEGCLKRLIRVLKDLLKYTLGNAVLTYEELLTVLCDCESIVNSHPLIYVPEDSDDL